MFAFGANRGFSRIGMAVLTMSALCLGSATASAAGLYKSITTNSNVRMDWATGNTHAWGGGPFQVEALTGVDNNTSYTDGSDLFKTFCVEANEGISIPSVSHVATLAGSGDFGKAGNSVYGTGYQLKAMTGIYGGSVITTQALANAANASTATNWLTYGAAALYKSYAMAIDNNVASSFQMLGLVGAAYTYSHSAADQEDLQRAIWYFQGQKATSQAAADANKYIDAVVDKITALSGSYTSLDIAGVQIMNLRKTIDPSDDPLSGGRLQSQLHWDGSGRSTAVPEPTAVAMWIMFGAIGAFAKRRRSQTC